MNRHRICLRLQRDLNEQLAEMANELGLPKNTIIQIAVQRLIREWKVTQVIV